MVRAPGAPCARPAERVDWGDAPQEVRRGVEALTGPVRSAVTAPAGRTAQLAATLDVPGGKVFVKAMPRDHRNAFTLANEARIAPSVRAVSPWLLHHGIAGGWEYLLFEHCAGRQANLSPGSPDLDPVASALRRLLGVAGHDTSTSVPVEQRWARFGSDLDLGLLAGCRLVHSDLNAGNILVNSGGASLVDWALPARGAPWLNVGFLLASLIGGGAAPAEAERWAQRTFPEWSAATTTAVDTFVAALARRRVEQAAACPEPLRAERQRLALSARRWLRHRTRSTEPAAPAGPRTRLRSPDRQGDTSAATPLPDSRLPVAVTATRAEPGRAVAVRVAIEELRALMAAACHAANLPEQETTLVVEHYLAGELRGKTSHGVVKFCFESRFFPLRESPPTVVRERGVFAVVDAHREIGPVSAAFAVRTALDKAARHGAGVVGMINTQRYGILATWTEQIARHGLLGIAANTSRAEATVAGCRTPLLGVNPLAFALPTLGDPLSADLSTTLAPMGVLWECRRSGKPLPAGCFVDADGQATDDPDRAVSAVVFGGHRGFAVSLLLQALTGSLFGFPMGGEVVDTWTTGYTFVALDPAFANPDGTTAAANSRLAAQMHAAQTADGAPLRVPGEHSRARVEDALAAGAVEIPEQVLRRLRARAGGDFDSD